MPVNQRMTTWLTLLMWTSSCTASLQSGVAPLGDAERHISDFIGEPSFD